MTDLLVTLPQQNLLAWSPASACSRVHNASHSVVQLKMPSVVWLLKLSKMTLDLLEV